MNKAVLSLFAGAVFSLTCVPTVSAQQQNIVVQCPKPVANPGWMPNEDEHPVIPGEPTTLKGVVLNTIPGRAYEYEWNFGDGTPSMSGSVTDHNAVEAEHTYYGLTDQVFFASLKVKDISTGSFSSANYPVKIVRVWNSNCPDYEPFRCADEISVKRIAIEKALWWAHKRLVRDPVKKIAYFQPKVNSNGYPAPEGMDSTVDTLITAQGFVDNGYKVISTPSSDPVYTEDVRQMVNYVMQKLQVVPIRRKGCPPNDPNCCLKCDPADTSCNPTCMGLDPENRGGEVKDGLGMYFAGQNLEYEIGAALRLLATCGFGEAWGPTSFFYQNSPHGPWTYRQVLQQMVDFLAWSQLYRYPTSNFPGVEDTNGSVPEEGRGGWPYWNNGWGWNQGSPRGSMGDVAIGYWTVDGIRAAEKMGAVVPDFVREELRRFLTHNQDLSGSPADNPYYGELYFGPARAHHLVERAGEGLVMFNWLGLDVDSPEVQGAAGFIDRHWYDHNYQHQSMWPWDQSKWGRDLSPNYSHFAKGELYEAGYWGDKCVDWGGNCYGQWVYIDGKWQCTNWVPNPPGSGPCQKNEWISMGQIDELNIFGFLTITQGLQAFGRRYSPPNWTSWLRDFPNLDNNNDDFEWRYLKLMVKNQLSNGSWDDSAWIYRMPLGHGWALMLLARLWGDVDGDGAPSGWDCDDLNRNISPEATEIQHNHIDENCNGMADDSSVDADRDGYQTPGDCDDGNPAIHPGAEEICNGTDENCNDQIDEGVAYSFFRDADGDGFGNLAAFVQACSVPEGYVSNAEDCDDGNASIYPNATEICNGLDDDCDGTTDENLSQTTTCGVGICAGNKAVKSCEAGIWVGSECDPMAGAKTEICNGLDDDCDGAADESGYLLGAFQQPVNADGTSIFNAGQTIPVKISVTDCAGNNVSDARVTIAVSMTSNQIQGSVTEIVVESSGDANSDNLFRYDAAGTRYIYNLSTKGYSSGTYLLSAAVGESAGNSVKLSLK